MAQGMPWRTEPEIDEARQAYLAERRAVKQDNNSGVYPFRDKNGSVKLDRADVEWLLATHESGGMRGPVDWADEKQRERDGLDVCGGDLSEAHLEFLPLARLRATPKRFEAVPNFPGMFTWNVELEERVRSQHAEANMRGAHLSGAHLEGAELMGVHLEGAFLQSAHLYKATLHRAHLEGSKLSRAHLEDAAMQQAHLELAQLPAAHFEGADLTEAHLEGAYLGVPNEELLSAREADELGGAHLEKADMWRVHLTGADLNRAHLQGAYLSASFLKCGRRIDV